MTVATAQTTQLTRRRTDRVVAGVAGGVADALGIPDVYARAAFITLGTVWGLGALLYLILWLVTFDRVGDRKAPQVDATKSLGLAIAFLGLMILLASFGWWPNVALVLTAGALAFGTAFLTDSSKPGPLAALMDPTVERPSRVRVIVGIGLLIGGLAIFATTVGQVFDFPAVFLAVMLTGVGLVVAFGPWVRRLLTDLSEERNERVRQEERAEVAAHLHDSVLQTLALIQRSEDPARMAILARHQESELRDWLYGHAPLDGIDLLSTALKQAASRVESDFQVPVDIVTVGDRTVDDKTRALIAAASEAMVNAAKHSGADKVSLFQEANEQGVEVFVTDQGKGFDPASISSDRRGIVDSIVSRMEKVGGLAEIDSEPGEGTEIMLRLPS